MSTESPWIQKTSPSLRKGDIMGGFGKPIHHRKDVGVAI
jgi:hypothetical protein